MMGKKKKKSSTVTEGSALGVEDSPETASAMIGPESGFKQEQTKSTRTNNTIKDSRLIPRIKEYLESRKNKKFVSVSALVDHLQSKYPEYGRKKKNMFAQYVERAYAVVEKQERVSEEMTGSSGQDLSGRSDGGSGSDSDSVGEILIEYKDTNAVNNMMSNLYRSSPSQIVDTPEQEDKKRKSSLSDSVKKRQKIEDFSVLDNNIGPRTPKDKENGSAAAFYIDRKGNSIGKGVNNSGDRLKEVSQITPSYNSAPSTRTLNFPSKETDTGLESKIIIKDNNNREIMKSVTQKETEEKRLEEGAIEETSSKQTKPTNTLEMSGRLGPGTEGETTELSNKSRREKTSKKTKRIVKSRKKDDSDEEKEKSKKDKGPAVQKSSLTFADIGGNEHNLQEICKLLVHMRHPEVYLKLGVTPPRGFLLHGPPGCGKTLLANAIAGELDLPLIKLAATEIVSGVSGDSEEKIRELFEKAVQCSPCVMFIDEIDAITPKRETASKDMERRIVAQLLACMDDLNANPDAQVLVIGATNRPDSIDPALRRAGRFDREICLGIPDEQSRLRILQVLCRGLRLSSDFDFLFLAKNTPGYVGADLMALTREAAMSAVNRVFQELQSQVVLEKQTAMEIDEHDPDPVQGIICDDKVLDEPSSGKNDSNSHTAAAEPNVIDTQKQNTDGQSAGALISTSSENETTLTQTSKHSCIGEKEISSQEDICVQDKSAESVTSDVKSHGEVCEGNDKDKESTGAVISDSVDTNSDKSLTEKLPGDGSSLFSDARTSDSLLASDKCTDNQSDVEMLAVDIGDKRSKNISAPGKGDNGKDIVSSEHEIPVPVNDRQKKPPELTSVLSWLKEQPPLTEEQLNDLYITMEDFKEALEHVQPSAKREGFATVPDVTWDDIGALHQIREELQLAILAPVRHAEEFRSLGLNRAQGVLLAGPPGCGKTLLAKAVANESGINFISVKGPELLNMYVGESEKAVRTVFQRARNSSPCVIFFDELDALCPRRSGTADSGSSSRVVNQLLTEMDGLEERKQVFIMAATNRPDIIDPAVLRPGRLDKTLYVGLPSQNDRLDIFRCITKNGTRPCLGQDVDLVRLANDQRCNGFTGADLAAFIREASVLALKEAILNKGRQPGDTIIVRGEHFEAAFSKIKPSVSHKDQEKYRMLGEKITLVS